MADIFLSYSSADEKLAEMLRKAFEACGWSVWWDKMIKPGEYFDKVIVSEIARAKCIIVLWSSNSVDSRWVLEEAKLAQEMKRLIPVNIEKVEPPFGYTYLNTVSLERWKGKIDEMPFVALFRAVHKKVNPSQETPIYNKLLYILIEQRKIKDFSPEEVHIYKRYVNYRIKSQQEAESIPDEDSADNGKIEDTFFDQIFRDTPPYTPPSFRPTPQRRRKRIISRRARSTFSFPPARTLMPVLIFALCVGGLGILSVFIFNQSSENSLIDSPEKLKVGEKGIFRLNGPGPDMAQASYTWKFGNGQPVFGNPVEYAFKKPGTYEVTVTMTTRQDTAIERKEIAIYHDRIVPKIRSLYAEPERLVTDVPVRFYADVITGDSLSYKWSLGDLELSTKERPQIPFKVPGTYTITLMIINDFGVDQQELDIVIEEANTPKSIRP